MNKKNNDDDDDDDGIMEVSIIRSSDGCKRQVRFYLSLYYLFFFSHTLSLSH